MKVLRNIKGVFKILFIIVLIGAVIAGTCVLFFHFFKKEENSYANVSTYIYSSERTDFIARIEGVKEKQLDSNNQNRFSIAISTYDTLNDIAKNIVPYLNAYSVNNKSIMNNYRDLTKQENALLNSISTFEYNVRDINFKPDEGANDIMQHLGNYLKKYASLLNVINGEISSKIQNKVDVTFYINDLYFIVVKNTMNGLSKTEAGILSFASTDNLNQFTNFKTAGRFKGYINTSINANRFIEAYSNFDKQSFAQKLTEKLAAATDLTDKSSNEDKVAFYLKQMFATEG